MAFRSIGASVQRFNSASSCDLIDRYDEYLENVAREDAEKVSSQTFAPSSMRCMRKSWFRLKGTHGDAGNISMELDFTARLGTAIHGFIQGDLSNMLGDDWIEVEEYFKQNPPAYTYQVNHDGYETQVAVDDPPVKFSVDGIVKINGIVYLLEIKTIEFSSWQNLSNPKDEHVFQVYTYCTMLNIDHVLFMYVDRQFGGKKCYEVFVPSYRMDEVRDSMDHVLECVRNNIPPERLPWTDKWCSSSMCPYYAKCKEWG